MRRYLFRVLKALSVLLNVIAGGPSGQTFSARNWAWKKQNRHNIVRLIDLVLGKDHCARSWVEWQLSRQKGRADDIL